MAEYYVFCDGSYNAELKRGVGAVLALSSLEWEQKKGGSVFTIRTKVMPATSIARVELMTALWALSDPNLLQGVRLFTDSKTIENLPERRAKLEANNYRSKRTGACLANADLYEQFFKIYDEVHPTITWVKGHSPSANQTQYQRVFRFVDKRARQVLRAL